MQDVTAPAIENHPLVAEWDERAAKTTTPCGEGRMVWRRWGEGEPLVLVHGGSGSWSHWIRNIPVLAERYTVWACDLPGQGDSVMPPAPTNMDLVADIVAEGIEAVLPEGKFWLAGFSFGGIVGGNVAVRLAARIRRLILIGTGTITPYRPTPPAFKSWRFAASVDELLAIQRYNLANIIFANAETADDLAVNIQAVNTRKSKYDNRKIIEHLSLAKALRSARPKVAGIWGEGDVNFEPSFDDIRAVLTEIDPTVRVEVLPGAGHWVQYEAADAVNVLLPELLVD